MITNLKNETTSEIIYPNIVGDNIPTGAVDSSKIATGAVTNTKIASLAVTNDKIASKSITADKIASKTITNDEISDETIQAGKIANSTLTANKIKWDITNLNDLTPPNIDALANILVKLLVEPNGYKLYYLKAVETDYDEFSTIEFSYNRSSGHLLIHMNGTTFNLTDNNSYSVFMTDYAKYIYLVNIW